MKKEMLINVLQPEECRIAILEDGVLEELYVERTSHESYVGNIYKGRIVNIEPSIQAAFVDFGVGRNGFLHVSDVEPAYYRHLEQRDGGGRRPFGRDRFRGGPLDEDEPRRPRGRRSVEDEMEEDLAAVEGDPAAEFLTPTESVAVAAPPPGDTPEEAAAPAAEPEPAKGRRRPRGGSRRRRQAPTAEGPAGSQEAPAADAGEGEPQAPPERPQVMDSAERRTEEGDPGPGPLSPSDEDIFFPRPQPAAAGAPAAAEPTQGREHDDGGPSFSEPEPPAWDEDGGRDEAFRADREPPREAGEPDEGAAPFEPREEEGLEDFDEPFPGFDEDDPGPRRRSRRRDDRRGDGRRRPGGRRGPGGRPGMGRPKPLIQDIFRRGQEVLVQVIKEGIGTKGPTLSTYISIAGRYLVLMPGLNRVGVSRKIADEEQRRRLRDIFHELKPPKGLGFIIRTAGIDRNKKELQADLAYLTRLWQVVVRRIRKLKAPAEIYQESDMITRTIRDTFTNDIDTIWVDEPNAYEHAREFLQIVMPRYASRIKLYENTEPLFHKYGIEEEIAKIHRRHVPLPNGGSIVIDQTEALVAIDVNSGNFRADNNAEETAYQMNLQAAKEIARQLRLRDLGGVIVNDFIDMREEKHRRAVERALREAVKRDRARSKILRISAFGLVEMTRQRIRPSLKRSVYQDCPHCQSTGQVKTCESMSIDVMRMLQLAAHRGSVQRVHVRVAEEVANYLLNKKRRDITRLEDVGGTTVQVNGVAGAAPEFLEFIGLDKNNNEVKLLPYEDTHPPRR